MHLACLMAGSSRRLMPLTATRHKAMLPVNGRLIIDYQLDAFRRAGIGSAAFVVGHGAADLTAHLVRSFDDLPLSVIDNDCYDTKNLDWSAFLALSAREGDVIYCEGDLLVPPSLLHEMTASEADVCLAVDSVERSSQVDALVLAPHGRVEALLFVEHGVAARRRGDGAVGEFICMLKLSDRARRFVVDRLGAQTFTGNMQLYKIFEEAFGRFTTRFVDAAGRPWVEVDNADDLERARSLADSILSA